VRRIAPATAIDFRCGDLLAPLEGERFGAIVSNPPYVSEPEVMVLPASVREHEPLGALVSTDDGLAHIERLLETAGDCLIDGGLLAVEVDSRRADRVRALAERAGWANGRIYRDLFGRSRYLLTTKE
jgi:release factor glutamine methyltransferase